MGSIDATAVVLSESEAERDHERRLAKTDHIWGFARMGLIVAGVVACVAIALANAPAFAGLTTIVSLSVNVAFTVSIVASVVATLTVTGGAFALKVARSAKRENRQLRQLNRDLRVENTLLKSRIGIVDTDPNEKGER